MADQLEELQVQRPERKTLGRGIHGSAAGLEQYGDRGNTDPRVHQEQRESVAAAERETQQQNRGNNQDYNTQRHRKYLLLSVFKWRD